MLLRSSSVYLHLLLKLHLLLLLHLLQLLLLLHLLHLLLHGWGHDHGARLLTARQAPEWRLDDAAAVVDHTGRGAALRGALGINLQVCKQVLPDVYLFVVFFEEVLFSGEFHA